MNKLLYPCLFLCSSIYATENNKPNVVLIMCDDLINLDGVYSKSPKIITPHINVFKKNSITFNNAHSIAPVSAPCRAALFTGVYPHISKNYGFNKWDKNKVLYNCKSIMEYFKENNYVVYGTGKLLHHNVKSHYTKFGLNNYAGPLAWDGNKPALHPCVPIEYASIGPLDGTFASLADIPNVKATADAPGYNGWYDTQKRKPFRYVNDENRDLLRDEEHVAWAKKTLQELAHAKNKQPFFLGVGFSKPHTALIAPDKYFKMYPLDEIELPTIFEDDENDCYLRENTPNSKGYKHYLALKKAFPNNFEEGLKRYIQAYLASVTFVDELIGELLTCIEESPFADNTIIIFVSDHGYDFGQKQYLFKNSLWATSTEVPFIVHYPFNKDSNGKQVDSPISLIDIYPTLVEVCKLKGSTLKGNNGVALSGNSLKPFLENKKTWDGPDVALSIVQNADGDTNPRKQNYSVKSKKWRYIRYSNGKEELYHSKKDIYERNNLASNPRYAAKKDELLNQLIQLVPSISK